MCRAAMAARAVGIHVEPTVSIATLPAKNSWPLSGPERRRSAFGAMPRVCVTQSVYQRSAATLAGESRHPDARRPSGHNTSPPPDQSHEIQSLGARSSAVPH